MSDLQDKFGNLQTQLSLQHGEMMTVLNTIASRLTVLNDTTTAIKVRQVEELEAAADMLLVLNDLHTDTISIDQKLLFMRNVLAPTNYNSSALTTLIESIRVNTLSGASNTVGSVDLLNNIFSTLFEHTPLLEAIRDCSCEEPAAPSICEDFTAELPISFLSRGGGDTYNFFSINSEGSVAQQGYIYVGDIPAYVEPTSGVQIGDLQWVSSPGAHAYQHNNAALGVTNTGTETFFILASGLVDNDQWDGPAVDPGQCVVVPIGDVRCFALVASDVNPANLAGTLKTRGLG